MGADAVRGGRCRGLVLALPVLYGSPVKASVRLALAALLPLAVVLLGCPADAPQDAETEAAFEPRPGTSVVLVSIDTLRADRLPAYGYDGVETPAIDALRADSILFERAYSHCPLTLPSHVSLFTGKLPPTTGVRDNAGYRLEEGAPSFLPTLLGRAGYRTGAAVSSYAIRATTGMAQGFELYDDRMEQEEASELWGPERFGDRTLVPAVEWLRKVAAPGSAEPFFLFFHLYEPHLPLSPPEPFRSRWGETYEAEVAAADAVVGDLVAELKRLGTYDDALVVLLSDHGEGLMDHGEGAHGIFVYPEVLQVPLMVKLPGAARAGTAVEEPVQLIDVLPTVLEVLGLDEPEGLEGSSLLGPLDGREIYSETYYPRLHLGWSDLASLIRGRFQYVEAPEPELYDLARDPGATRNVLRENRRVYSELRERMKDFRRPLEMPTEEDPETLAKLAALGYLATSAEPVEGELPDPKSQIQAATADAELAQKLFQERRFAEAILPLESILERNPRRTDAWRQLGTALKEAGRYEESLEAFEKTLELTRGSPQVLVQAGQVLVLLGRRDDARRHGELAAEREPLLAAELRLEIALAEGDLDAAMAELDVRFGQDRISRRSRMQLASALSDRGRHREALALVEEVVAEKPGPSTWNVLALVLINGGRGADAEPVLERVLAEDASNALANERRGLLELQRGRPDAARGYLDRALDTNDQAANAWNLLGVARFQLRDIPGALDAWQKSVEIDPEQWDSLYNLGFTAARAGRRQQAVDALRLYVATAPSELFSDEIAEARRLLGQLEGR